MTLSGFTPPSPEVTDLALDRELVRLLSAREQHPDDCPECRAGKHVNCTGQAYDAEADSFVPCGCQAGGHA